MHGSAEDRKFTSNLARGVGAGTLVLEQSTSRLLAAPHRAQRQSRARISQRLFEPNGRTAGQLVPDKAPRESRRDSGLTEQDDPTTFEVLARMVERGRESTVRWAFLACDPLSQIGSARSGT